MAAGADVRKAGTRCSSSGHRGAEGLGQRSALIFTPEGHTADLPLGVQSGELHHALPLRLGHGDTLILTTDGLTDARPDRTTFLGLDGLREIVEAVVPASPFLSQTAERAVEHAREFARGGFRDDMCLLLARRK